MYAPFPKNQESYSTCVAWASAYCGRTMVDAIKNDWTDRATITKNAYSPAFLFRLIQPGDGGCSIGSYVGDAFATMKTRGSLPYNSLPLSCVPQVDATELSMASSWKLKDYARLFDVGASANLKIQSVKKSLLVTAIDNNNNKASYRFNILRNDVSATTQASLVQSASQGKFYAVIIGVQDYQDPNIQSLAGPVNDAGNLVQALAKNYTFAPEDIQLLKKPTRAQVLRCWMK